MCDNNVPVVDVLIALAHQSRTLDPVFLLPISNIGVVLRHFVIRSAYASVHTSIISDCF